MMEDNEGDSHIIDDPFNDRVWTGLAISGTNSISRIYLPSVTGKLSFLQKRKSIRPIFDDSDL